MTTRPILASTPFWVALVVLLAAVIGVAHGPSLGAGGADTPVTVAMLAVDAPTPDSGGGAEMDRTAACAAHILCGAAFPASSAALAASPEDAWPPVGGMAWAARSLAPDDRPPIRLV